MFTTILQNVLFLCNQGSTCRFIPTMGNKSVGIKASLVIDYFEETCNIPSGKDDVHGSTSNRNSGCIVKASAAYCGDPKQTVIDSKYNCPDHTGYIATPMNAFCG